MLTRLAWLAVLLFAVRASALTVCEETSAPDPEPEPTVASARLILPCALAENAMQDGELACADASIYVVTHDGVLLCQIDVPTLAPSTGPQIEQAPSATLSTSTAFAAAGLAGAPSSLMPPLVVELPEAGATPVSTPRDGFTRPPAVPS